jgi:hypothetical protein
MHGVAACIPMYINKDTGIDRLKSLLASAGVKRRYVVITFLLCL